MNRMRDPLKYHGTVTGRITKVQRPKYPELWRPISRAYQRALNIVRGVPPVLACLALFVLSACAAEVTTDPAPACRVTAEATAVCTTRDLGSPLPDFGLLCDAGNTPIETTDMFAVGTAYGVWCHVPPALVCERVETEPHGCASSGCWATLACNRNPSSEMGVTCVAKGDTFACNW